MEVRRSGWLRWGGRVLLAAVAAGAAPGQHDVHELQGGVGPALATAERTGAFLLRTDLALAVAAVDLAAVSEALLYARQRSLGDFLRVAVELELAEHPPAAGERPGAALGALLTASQMIGNQLPRACDPALVAALEADVELDAFVSWPAHSEIDQPPGQLRARPHLAALYETSRYLHVATDERNPEPRALLFRLLHDERLAGVVDVMRQHHAITAHLFGQAAPHLFDDPNGSFAPQVEVADNLLGSDEWMQRERIALERFGAEYACLWFGRMLSAETSTKLGWPATRANTTPTAGAASSARSWLVKALGENARSRPLPPLLREEGQEAWARRRLVASVANYIALRGYDGIDVPCGPVTGLPPPPPRVRWFVEPLPEVFDALAQCYAEFEWCAMATGRRLDLIGSSSGFATLAECARAAAQQRELDPAQSALVHGFVQRAKAKDDLPSEFLQVTPQVWLRCGKLRGVEVTIVLGDEVLRAGSCEWAVEALQGSRPVEQQLTTPWRDVAERGQ